MLYFYLMDRWYGKVAVVTGASVGIGAAILLDLVKSGCIVVGLAREEECIEEFKSKIPTSVKGSLHALKCDISKEEDIKNAFAWIETNLGSVDILVNNAGIVKSTQLVDTDDSAAISEVVDINILGVVLCTREAVHIMKKHNINGHIILINNIDGHKVPYMLPSLNIYPATKYAVTALTEVLQDEFQMEGTKIEITVK